MDLISSFNNLNGKTVKRSVLKSLLTRARKQKHSVIVNRISNVLKQNKAKITVKVDGLAASIASIIAMSGDEIVMAENAMMMIHNAWTITAGNAASLREAADMLEKVDGQLVKTYTSRAKVDEKTITDLMTDETWMTAEEAMVYGLIDSISESLDVAACFDLKKFRYKNIPQKIRADPENRTVKQKMASNLQRLPHTALSLGVNEI